jgi:hypothetical protein
VHENAIGCVNADLQLARSENRSLGDAPSSVGALFWTPRRAKTPHEQPRSHDLAESAPGGRLAADATETGGVACRKPLTVLGTSQKSVGVFWRRIAARRLTGHEWPVAASQYLKTRVSPDTKRLVQCAAIEQFVTESVWLRRIVLAAQSGAFSRPDQEDLRATLRVV